MKPDSDWKESGSLSVEYKYDRLQWSSVVYENYIYIFGGDSGKILWIDVGDEPYKQGEKLQRLPRWSEGVAFVQNFWRHYPFGYVPSCSDFAWFASLSSPFFAARICGIL